MAAFGTNYRGDVIGRYGAESVAHGYVFLRGSFITVDPPGSTVTAARGIDDLRADPRFHLGSDHLLSFSRVH
jgi:hypothetical protein